MHCSTKKLIGTVSHGRSMATPCYLRCKTNKKNRYEFILELVGVVKHAAALFGDDKNRVPLFKVVRSVSQFLYLGFEHCAFSEILELLVIN